MNQTICDACGSVIKFNENHQSNVWGATTLTTTLTLVNADICNKCWNKIKQKGVTE